MKFKHTLCQISVCVSCVCFPFQFPNIECMFLPYSALIVSNKAANANENPPAIPNASNASHRQVHALSLPPSRHDGARHSLHARPHMCAYAHCLCVPRVRQGSPPSSPTRLSSRSMSFVSCCVSGFSTKPALPPALPPKARYPTPNAQPRRLSDHI